MGQEKMWAEDASWEEELMIWSRVPSRGQNHMMVLFVIPFNLLGCFELERYRRLRSRSETTKRGRGDKASPPPNQYYLKRQGTDLKQ